MRSIVIALLVGVFVFGIAMGGSAQSKEPRFPDLKREQWKWDFGQ